MRRSKKHTAHMPHLWRDKGYDISETVDPAMENAPQTSDYGVWVPGIPVLVQKGLDAVNCAGWLEGLILDGIVGGVGAVLGFVPQMLVLFLMLAFLEACGYMARIAFVMDRCSENSGSAVNPLYRCW